MVSAHQTPPGKKIRLPDPVAIVRDAVRRGLGVLGPSEACVLAVSGGVDSMVLLDAAASVREPKHLVVASFDHGTGTAATAALDVVRGRAEALGVAFVAGRGERLASEGDGLEAVWRDARWAFLRSAAAACGGVIATAHTRDDQVETVFMRALREAGPRGLAGLYAASPILRPLLGVPKAMVEAYAKKQGITFISDPSNVDRRHLRNRVRHDLLPALRAVRPHFDDDLLAVAAKAAAWRARVDHLAASFTMMNDSSGAWHLPRAQFAGYTHDALRVLWPAVVARAGIVMDWRGTHRLATFTIEGVSGQSIQLSGGVEVRMRRDALVVRRVVRSERRG